MKMIIFVADDEIAVGEKIVLTEHGAIPMDRHKAKYFLFDENRRPPYWGAWRKKSQAVKPRKPRT